MISQYTVINSQLSLEMIETGASCLPPQQIYVTIILSNGQPRDPTRT